MDEMEALKQELQAMNAFRDEYLMNKMNTENSAFMTKFGPMFSNREDIGNSIINDFRNHGMDINSVTNEIMMESLRKLRTEGEKKLAQCKDLLEAIKELKEEVIEQNEKIGDMQDAVEKNIAADPDSTADITDALGELNTNSDTSVPEPEPQPMPEPEPQPMPEPQAVPEPEPQLMPEPQVVPEPEPIPEPEPQVVPSDERLKKINAVLANKPKKTPANSFKPSSGMLEAAQRGW